MHTSAPRGRALKEADLLEEIRRRFRGRGGLAPGDDAAYFRVGKEFLVVSVDTFVEGTHFLVTENWEDLGYRFLVRVASDAFAMGAMPWQFYVAAVWGEAFTPARHEAFLRGMARAQRRVGGRLCGGDLARGRETVFVGAVIGRTERVIRRDGAREGDEIWVSGTLGGARVCWERGQSWRPPVRRRLVPLLREVAHAAIDVSDGLLRDLARLAEASQLKAVLEVEKVPIAPVLRGMADARERALQGGEDYELLWTAARRWRARILREARQRGIRVTRIGWMEKRGPREGPLVAFVGGEYLPLRVKGWEHAWSEAP